MTKNGTINEYTPSTSLRGLKQTKGSSPDKQDKTSPSEPETQPDEPVEDIVVAGINSEVYPDSLINLLKPLGFLTKDEKGQLLILMLNAAKEDNVVLEAIGVGDDDPRKFSPDTSAKLNDLVASFKLPPTDRKKLEMTLNKWARLNTVKFSSPERSTPEPDADVELPPPADEKPSSASDPRDLPEPGPAAAALEVPQFSYPDSGRPVPNPEELTITNRSTGERIKATDENALERSLEYFMPDINEGPGELSKAIKTSERILRIGGGLAFENMRTSKITDKPKWQQNDDGGLTLPYYGRYIAPKKITNRIKDFLSNPSSFPTGGIFGSTKYADKVSQQSTNNLKKYIALLKQEQERREKIPGDPDEYALQESFKRMQTLAGINKRIL